MAKKPFQPSTSYELFILALSIFSIFNIFLYYFPFNDASKIVVQIVDLVLCVIFFGDFLYRLTNTDSKTGYFIQERGWLDLLGSLPFPGLRFARVFRIFRSAHIIRKFGLKNMLAVMGKNKATSALYVVIFLIMLVLEFGSMGVLEAEASSPNANIKTASDALWWTYVTITTVGYGDRFPVTDLGRIVGVIVLTTGVGLFGVLTGFLANAFLQPKKEELNDSATVLPINSEEIIGQLKDLQKKIDRLSGDKR